MSLKRTITLLLLSPAAILFAQDDVLYNHGGELYIQENALLKIQGSLVNENHTTSAVISNDGTIELDGDIENKTGATFGVHTNDASKERAVKFVGNGTQLIKGDFATPGQSGFYNLVIDKASAADTVEMRTEVLVEGTLAFGSASITSTYQPSDFYTNNNHKGLLKTYSADNDEFLLNIQNGNPDAISGYPALEIDGAPSTGFVLTSGIRGSNHGGLQRKVASATSYLFPVGTEGRGFNGAMLNFTSVPGNGNVKTKFCEGTSNTIENTVGTISAFCVGCDEDNPADNRGYNRYFASNDCNGGAPQWVVFDHTAYNHGYWSFESSNTGYQYDIEVFPNTFPDDYANRNNSWRVLKHEGPYNEDPSAEGTDWTGEIESSVSNISDLTTFTRNMGCYSGNGVPGGSYTDFSHFTMGMSGSGSALPVKLLYVRAEPMGKHRIRVSWATSLEINNDGFEVHRSTDGVNFTKIGWVDGHDNSTITNYYNFEDRGAEVGVTYYYRLKQIDNDLKFEYSQVVQAKLGGDEVGGFSLYPNPTANDVFLNVVNPAGEITVRIYDTKGVRMFENIFTVEQDGVDQTVNIKASAFMPPGTYVITGSTNGRDFSSKFVLQ
jgi:hypothetical protein